MSDTWSDLQAFKSRQSSLRERLQRRKQEVKGMVLGITNELVTNKTGSRPCSPANVSTTATIPEVESEVKTDAEIEQQLLACLCNVALNLPTDSRALVSLVAKALNRKVPHLPVENLLQKFAVQELITIKEGLTPEGKSCFIISSAEHTKLVALSVSQRKTPTDSESKKRVTHSVLREEPTPKKPAIDSIAKEKYEDSIESLLSLPSAREKETKKVGAEILELLSKPTAKERSLVERFRSQGGAQVKEFCPHGVTEECTKLSGTGKPCIKLHFKKIIQKHTDESLGDCSFLNTCFHMDTCKYVHYEVDYSTVNSLSEIKSENLLRDTLEKPTVLYPSQWIQCDLRFFDMLILGKFAVIMADPPWDIHMELPYGTLSDDEMRQLNVPGLQDEGLIFLWVTGKLVFPCIEHRNELTFKVC